MAETETRTSPTLTEVIREAIERRVADIHTAMPATVVSYDHRTNLVNVKPLFTRKFVTEETSREIPIISNVPVLMYRTAGAHFRLPIAKDDTGLLLFAERSLDEWIDNGGVVNPTDPRKHALSDATFLPGLSPVSEPMSGRADPSSLEIWNENGFVEIKKSGKIRIGNSADELLGLLNDTLSVLKSLTVDDDDGGGPVPLPVSAAVQAKIVALQSRLSNLKG